MSKMVLQMHPDTGETTLQTPSMPVPESVPAGSMPGPLMTRAPAPAAPATPPQGEPQLILGKFKSADELAAAYKALEAKLGAPAAKPATTETTETPGEPATPATPEGAPSGSLTEADMTRFGNEVLSTGNLSQSSYDEIMKKTGLPRATIDAHVALMKRDAEAQQAAILAEVGGPEKVEAMTAWAAEGGLTKQEAEEYSAAVQSGDEKRIKLALRYLKTRFDGANSSDPGQVYGGRGPSAPAVQPFDSWSQVTAAMESPLYREDPSYRKQVQDRLAVSHNIAY